jgi:hypothetical protein
MGAVSRREKKKKLGEGGTSLHAFLFSVPRLRSTFARPNPSLSFLRKRMRLTSGFSFLCAHAI